MTESVDYPYSKTNVMPKVEGFKSVPRDEESKAHILYQTTSQAYGKMQATKFELPIQRHPLKQTISAYQGSSLGHRSGALNNSRTPNPLGEDDLYTARQQRQKHIAYTNKSK